MFTEALRELRHHPGRMVATLVAIAVSVGFLVGISMFVRTQGVALGKEQAVATSKADVVVDTNGAVVDPDEVTRTIKETQGVGAVDTVLSTSMPAAHGHDSVMIDLHQVPEEPFRWSTVKDGSWPSKADEVALSEDAAKQLQVSIGDTVAFSGHDLKVVGITDDPSALQTAPAYVGQLPGQAPNTWVIKAKDGTAPGQLVTNLEKTLSKVKDAPQFNKDDAGATISTADSFQKKTINSLTEDFDVTKYMLMVFGAIALLVGAIIITTTFLILLAQRRRQIGLMRAVGASSGQVRRRVLAEAIVLGVLGSVLGVVLGILLTVAGTAYTGALAFGLAWPWGDIIVEFLIGIVITVLAAFLPALQATRVAPLEALRPVPTVEQKRRIGIARIVVCSLLAVAGIALSVGAIVGTGTSIIVMAILSAMCLSLTLLIATPLYVPWLIRAMGLLLRPLGPTARLSTSNANRNPTRTSLTAVALMLAIGLSVTLQVGISTTRTTVMDQINEHFPIDLTLTNRPSYDPNTGQETASTLDTSALKTVQDLPNVKDSIVLKGGFAESDLSPHTHMLSGNPDEIAKVAPSIAKEMKPGVALITSMDNPPQTMTFTSSKGKVALKVMKVHGLSEGDVVVNQEDLKRIVPSVTDQSIWVHLNDRSNLASTLTVMMSMSSSSSQHMDIGGGALIGGIVELILKVLLMVMTALLGVAVLIALIGVANTLSLSVLERRRESALLRAMGMQRRGLRLMLLYESIQVGMVGVIVGMVAGFYFAWLGIRSVFRVASDTIPVHFSIDWPWTLGLIAICLVAACLASVLPGRRAAKAIPTEALADE
ncbi:ABC transporter permease [Cutibacterium acnes]|uniref:ABC transporter permease n=1 Tax=Cutibacterium acnes TaxID=1747 RepID=UPI001E58CB37|nr:FtsX-like permease family protein [Cutibacterium acnes]MCD1066489.1 FtsX-like permease family protein [Cutibacterium acnes]MCP9405224.1 FtsX-like permease family protein [Cutibacterium acnes]